MPTPQRWRARACTAAGHVTTAAGHVTTAAGYVTTAASHVGRRKAVLSGGGEAAGEGRRYLWERIQQPRHSAPHRVRQKRAVRAGLCGRRHGSGLARAATVALRPKLRDYRAAVFEQDVAHLSLAAVIVTRRGVRQQHEMTARRAPRLGPILRERVPGARAVPCARVWGRMLRHFRRRNLVAKHWAHRAASGLLYPTRRGTSAPAACRLAASMAHMRTFVCALPGPFSACVWRKQKNSAGMTGIAVDPFAAANCCKFRRAGT